MKQNIGELSEADLKARRRFWNKRGFFGEPDKKAIERDSMKMQKLVKALRTFSLEEVKRIRATKYPGRFFTNDMYTVRNASESDFNHAISTFKIF
jgi:dipeptidase